MFTRMIACLALGIGMAANGQVPTAQEKPEQHQVGNIILPVVGVDGVVEYDVYTHRWTIAIQAPEDWDCDVAGFWMPAEDTVPTIFSDSRDGAWLASGTISMEIVEEGCTLQVTVEGDDRTCVLTFAYSPDDTLDSVVPFYQDDDGEIVGEHPTTESCAGGWCECQNICVACCQEGYHPSCPCKSEKCLCIANQELSAMPMLDYTVTYTESMSRRPD
jgi:hypothetical protein